MTAQQQEAWVPADTFGLRLLMLRRHLGLSVKEASRLSGIHYATWSTWENGSSPADKAAVVAKLNATFGVDRNWLMWGGPLRDTNSGTNMTP